MPSRPGNALTHAAQRVLFAANVASIARRARNTPPRPGARDRRVDRLPNGLEIHAYWVQREGEVGPGVSVFACDQEVLRLDLLEEHPHVHYGPAQLRVLAPWEERVYVQERTPHDLIERGVFEVEHNLPWCLRTHPSRRVRDLLPSRDERAAAAARLRATLYDIDARHRA